MIDIAFGESNAARGAAPVLLDERLENKSHPIARTRYAVGCTVLLLPALYGASTESLGKGGKEDEGVKKQDRNDALNPNCIEAYLFVYG